MLSPTAVNALTRPLVRRTSRLASGAGLKAILIVSALIYVLAPVVAQWASYEPVRQELAAIRIAEPPEPSSIGLDGVIDGSGGAESWALGSVGDLVPTTGWTVVETMVRALQVSGLFTVLFIVSLRSTVRYRPRHGSGVGAAVLTRKR